MKSIHLLRVLDDGLTIFCDKVLFTDDRYLVAYICGHNKPMYFNHTIIRAVNEFEVSDLIYDDIISVNKISRDFVLEDIPREIKYKLDVIERHKIMTANQQKERDKQNAHIN